MSTLQIEERITVTAPPARVWEFLLDPARVAACLPGAKLDGTEGDSTFLGTMKVKVGPVLMEIKGKATMSDIDPVERRVTLSGTGNDKAGGGSARMDMKSQILEVEGGSEIVVHAEVHLAGKLVRFGRGMMEGISKQLFKQFAERVHTALDQDGGDEEEQAPEAPEGPAPPAPAAATPVPEEEKAPVEEAPPPADTAPAEKAPVEEAPPADTAPAEKAPVEEAPPADTTPAEKAPPTDTVGAPAETTPGAPAPRPKKKPATKKAIVPPQDNAPLDAGSLVWSAIWAWIKGLFRRIFGRRS